MLSQTFRNPNVELAAAGLATVASSFVYGLFGIAILLDIRSGTPVAASSAGLLAFLLLVTGMGVLWRASWGWKVGLVGYTIGIGLQLWWWSSVGGVLEFLATLFLAPLLLGSFLYVLLSKDEFKTTSRPSEIKRPFYR